MKSIRYSSFALALVLGGAIVTIAGCANEPKTHSHYGAVPAVELPADAKLIAYGAYPIPLFCPPRDGGRLYIYDENIGRVVMVTTIPPQSLADRMGAYDIEQLPGNEHSLDTGHRFQVFWEPGPDAPSHMHTAPLTTQPVAAGQ